MVKSVLSIDFDYIMFPCIKLYNDLSSGGENSTVIWNNIEHFRGVDDKFLSYDPESYITIAKLLKSLDNDTKKIAISEHQSIVDILIKDENSIEHDIDEIYESWKFNLINIDFHHDIIYRPQDRNTIKNFDKYNCSNWVGYLMLKNKIENYTWIKAPNSDLYDHNLDGKYDIKFETESMRLVENIQEFIDNNKFDYVFLCLSPQWVPYKFKHLYDLLVELFDFRKE